jgi:hypothetical protein
VPQWCQFATDVSILRQFYPVSEFLDRVNKFLGVIHAGGLRAPKLAALQDSDEIVASRVMVERAVWQTYSLFGMMTAEVESEGLKLRRDELPIAVHFLDHRRSEPSRRCLRSHAPAFC